MYLILLDHTFDFKEDLLRILHIDWDNFFSDVIYIIIFN